MTNSKVSELLNQQINKEFYSSYLYLDFANYYIEQGLNGFANWFKVQAQEELDHALLFTQYMQNNSLKVTFDIVENPSKAYHSSMEPLKESLAHEAFITESIHTIYDVAYSLKDFRTMQFLDWFVREQGEEEKNATDLIRKMELFGNESKSLYMLDQELAGRMYNPPSLIL
jgi:ferritin